MRRLSSMTVGFAVAHSPSVFGVTLGKTESATGEKEATHRTLVNDQHARPMGSLPSSWAAVGMKTGYAGIGQPTRALESTGNPYSDASMRRAARAGMSTTTTSPRKGEVRRRSGLSNQHNSKRGTKMEDQMNRRMEECPCRGVVPENDTVGPLSTITNDGGGVTTPKTASYPDERRERATQ